MKYIQITVLGKKLLLENVTVFGDSIYTCNTFAFWIMCLEYRENKKILYTHFKTSLNNSWSSVRRDEETNDS